MLEKGHLLDAAGLGLAASQGYAELSVYRTLKIIVFSTGNEVCEPGDALSKGKIYDANRYQLLAWLPKLGATVTDGGIISDDLIATERALVEAAKAYDVIITSGGASVGEADYLKQAITQVGKLTTHSLAIKPGKPFAWGNIGHTQVFILPGNPVAAFATSHMLLYPVLNSLAGKAERYWQLPYFYGIAHFQTKKAIKRREFLRAWVDNKSSETVVTLLPNQGSAMLATCTQANALCEVPIGSVINEGDRVKVYLLPF